MALASLIESEISISRLLDLLDVAREQDQGGNYISMPAWQQTLRELESS